jgi:predicted phosphoribosyltransferase
VAVPGGPSDTLEAIQKMEEVTEAVCPLVPDMFFAVSQLYYDFRQVEDDEVIGILKDFQENNKRRA